jgi:drug/metabolite transporter (DMT)-like permease
VTSLLLIIAVAIWGVSFVATKLCLDYLTPPQIIAARFLLGVPVLIGIVWAQRLSLRFIRSHWKILTASALVLVLHLLIQVEGMKTTTATNTAWLITTIPVFIVALSYLFLKERITLIQGAGMALAAFGVLVLVSRGQLGSLDFIRSHGDWLVLASAVTWSVFTILGKKTAGLPPLAAVTVVLTIAAVILTPPVLAVSGMQVYLSLPWRIVAALVFLGLFCLSLAYWFWTEALKRKTAGQVGAYLYLEPVSTMMVAPFVLGEAITPSLVGGGILVIAGVWLVERGKSGAIRALFRSRPQAT